MYLWLWRSFCTYRLCCLPQVHGMASVVRISLVPIHRSPSAFPFGPLCSTTGTLFGKIWRFGEIITGGVRLEETTVGSRGPTPCLSSVSPEHKAEDCVQLVLEYPQGETPHPFWTKGRGRGLSRTVPMSSHLLLATGPRLSQGRSSLLLTGTAPW